MNNNPKTKKPMPERARDRGLTGLQLHQAKQKQNEKTVAIKLHDAHNTIIMVRENTDAAKVVKRFKKNYATDFSKLLKKMKDEQLPD